MKYLLLVSLLFTGLLSQAQTTDTAYIKELLIAYPELKFDTAYRATIKCDTFPVMMQLADVSKEDEGWVYWLRGYHITINSPVGSLDDDRHGYLDQFKRPLNKKYYVFWFSVIDPFKPHEIIVRPVGVGYTGKGIRKSSPEWDEFIKKNPKFED